MSGFVWWFGLLHLAIYAFAGSVAAIGWCAWKVHAHLRLMGVILRWHFQRKREVLPAPAVDDERPY